MRNKNSFISLLYLLPSLAGVLFFYLVPFADILNRSFMDDMGLSYIGIQNYARLLHSKNFLLAGRNTLIFIAVSTPVLLSLSLCIAVLLHQKSKEHPDQKTYSQKSILLFLLPMAIPVAALTGVWKILFHEYGLLNALRHLLGLPATDWLASSYSMAAVIITYLWRNTGYTMVLWLAGLSAIDPVLYEASALEGAGSGRQFYHITLPLLKPLGFTVSVLSVLNTFKVFRDIYLLSGDYPDKNIYMIQHILNNWFTNMEFGKITAAALVIVFIAGWLVLGLQFSFSFQKRGHYYDQTKKTF